jgi:hypothetical protein
MAESVLLGEAAASKRATFFLKQRKLRRDASAPRGAKKRLGFAPQWRRR